MCARRSQRTRKREVTSKTEIKSYNPLYSVLEVHHSATPICICMELRKPTNA